jgi:GcrA cell cycle regulator
MQGPLWDDERTALLIKLWSVDKLSASQCAGVIGCGLSRNAIIGKVHRLQLEKRRTVKASPVKAKKQSGGNGSAGKYRGVVAAANKARAAKTAPPKPERITLPPIFTPDAATLAAGAWDALPGTTPITLLQTNEHTCKWPVSPEGEPFMFCGAHTAEGASWCPTHKQRARGPGTPSEQSATKSARSMVRLEQSYGFRSNQAGQSL